MSHIVLLLSLLLAAAPPCVAQTESQQAPPPAPVDLYAHTLADGLYTNPALGLTVKYPDGWEFIDTAFLHQQDDEDSKKYRDANPLLAEKGVIVNDVSNLFVAQKNASAPVHPMIYLKTQGVELPTVDPGTYFTENEFFASRAVKFLSKPELVTINGNKLSQADIGIKQPKGKPFFARIAVAYLANPTGHLGRYVVFEFLNDSIEQVRHDSEMLQTLQLTTPQPAIFLTPAPAKQ